MSKRIALFTRKPIQGFHYSIENTLNEVRAGLLKSGKWEIDWIEMPWYSKGFIPRLKLILFAWFHKHEMNHIIGDIYFIALLLPGKSLVITIHDVLFLYPKKGISWLVLWFFWVYLPVLKAKSIITISNHTKNEIIRYTGCNAKKIKVIPCLISPHFSSSPKDFNHHYPIILHIGTAWNKNLSNHIQAVKDIPCLLKIVGKLSENHRLELIKAGIDFENVVQLSDHEVLSLYHSCDILLFASLAEGFGLPILEAQRVGRAVITSNRGAMAEVAGKGALLVDPLSVESIRDGLISIIHNDSLRELCISDGFKNTHKYGRSFILAQHDRLFSSILS
jgi:glycosyltransferase involved in cell wall biosynthesis